MLIFLIAAISVIIDQLTKLWASSALTTEATSVIPGIINFRYVENRGIVFGFFQNGTLIVTIITSIFVCFIIFFLVKYRKNLTRPVNICLAIVLGGALGNLIDRVFAGYVVDFIEFAFVEFAVFNFADICITVGAVALLIYLLFFEQGRVLLKGLYADGKERTGRNDGSGKDNH